MNFMSCKHCSSYIRGKVYAFLWKMRWLNSKRAPATGAVKGTSCTIIDKRDWGINKFCTFKDLLRKRLLEDP
jgi:hypothetical protein